LLPGQARYAGLPLVLTTLPRMYAVVNILTVDRGIEAAVSRRKGDTRTWRGAKSDFAAIHHERCGHLGVQDLPNSPGCSRFAVGIGMPAPWG
jgi:hypothetical protein